ncbi:hypothetical protein HDU91_000009 [Kappamyces sp. JEL0680]|nr:hypothetical protein HDU91_000009 [Kappamyces sp. JEL0680]
MGTLSEHNCMAQHPDKPHKFLPILDFTTKSLYVRPHCYSSKTSTFRDALELYGIKTNTQALNRDKPVVSPHLVHKTWCRISLGKCTCRLASRSGPATQLVRIGRPPAFYLECIKNKVEPVLDLALRSQDVGAADLTIDIFACLESQKDVSSSNRSLCLVYPVLDTYWNHNIGERLYLYTTGRKRALDMDPFSTDSTSSIGSDETGNEAAVPDGHHSHDSLSLADSLERLSEVDRGDEGEEDWDGITRALIRNSRKSQVSKTDPAEHVPQSGKSEPHYSVSRKKATLVPENAADDQHGPAVVYIQENRSIVNSFGSFTNTTVVVKKGRTTLPTLKNFTIIGGRGTAKAVATSVQSAGQRSAVAPGNEVPAPDPIDASSTKSATANPGPPSQVESKHTAPQPSLSATPSVPLDDAAQNILAGLLVYSPKYHFGMETLSDHAPARQFLPKLPARKSKNSKSVGADAKIMLQSTRLNSCRGVFPTQNMFGVRSRATRTVPVVDCAGQESTDLVANHGLAAAEPLENKEMRGIQN